MQFIDVVSFCLPIAVFSVFCLQLFFEYLPKDEGRLFNILFLLNNNFCEFNKTILYLYVVILA